MSQNIGAPIPELLKLSGDDEEEDEEEEDLALSHLVKITFENFNRYQVRTVRHVHIHIHHQVGTVRTSTSARVIQ
jgi:hypothetical protein